MATKSVSIRIEEEMLRKIEGNIKPETNVKPGRK